jgi:predicted MFS family arabinose efflux permease
MAKAPTPPSAFTGYQKFVIAVLAFLQFTVVLDFMILSPLGAILMQELKIPAGSFGLAVSAYALSAGASGLLAAGFADRFDRKRFLLFFYVGFVLGTLCCGLAPDFRLLLAARVVTGLFGGVIGSTCLAILADLFPPESRGRVMGAVQAASAASQVMGIPIGLWLANRWGWHAPFVLIAAVGAAAGAVIAARLRPVDGHLAARPPRAPFRHLFATVSRGEYVRAYASSMLMVTGGFMMMPFASAFTVENLGVSLERLPLIYMATGMCSIVAGPLLGRLSDSLGKYRIFLAGTAVSVVMVVCLTNLGASPLWLVALVNVALSLGVTSRMIAGSALTSVVPAAPDRGAFMAISASGQQIAGGVASAAAGLIVTRSPGGAIAHYDTIGYVVVTSMCAATAVLYTVNRAVAARPAAGPVRAAGVA